LAAQSGSSKISRTRLDPAVPGNLKAHHSRQRIDSNDGLIFSTVCSEVKHSTDKHTHFVLPLLRETDIPRESRRQEWAVCLQIETRRMGGRRRFEKISRLFVARRQQFVCGVTAFLSANCQRFVCGLSALSSR
jgi:hypothetical protein